MIVHSIDGESSHCEEEEEDDDDHRNGDVAFHHVVGLDGDDGRWEKRWQVEDFKLMKRMRVTQYSNRDSWTNVSGLYTWRELYTATASSG